MNPSKMEGDRRIEAVTDVFAMVMPTSIDPLGPTAAMTVYVQAVRLTFAQFEHLPESERPRVRFGRIDTLVTSDVLEAERFQPAHNCQECIKGTELTRQHLRDNPGSTVALANIFYTTEI